MILYRFLLKCRSNANVRKESSKLQSAFSISSSLCSNTNNHHYNTTHHHKRRSSRTSRGDRETMKLPITAILAILSAGGGVVNAECPFCTNGKIRYVLLVHIKNMNGCAPIICKVVMYGTLFVFIIFIIFSILHVDTHCIIFLIFFSHTYIHP